MYSNRSLLLLTILTLLPATTLAGGFVPLVGVPGIGTNIDFSDYINAIYALAISIAALLAVVKLVLAGAQYMLSDIVTSKQSAKEDIKGALIGLLIVIAAVLILSTINDDITDFAIGAPTFTYEGTPSNPSGNTGGNGGGGGIDMSGYPQGSIPVVCNGGSSGASCGGVNCPAGYTDTGQQEQINGQNNRICAPNSTGGGDDGDGGGGDDDSDANGGTDLAGTTFRINCNNASCSSTPCPDGSLSQGVGVTTAGAEPRFQRICLQQ